jgi:hypothetical protein
MSGSQSFRAAVEASDMDSAVDTLAPEIVFRSPVVFKPYEDRAVIVALLHVVFDTFEDFRYVKSIGAPGDRDTAHVFKARVGERELDGVDLLHENEDGLIDDFTVMVRPMSGVLALAEAMKRNLEAAGYA